MTQSYHFKLLLDPAIKGMHCYNLEVWASGLTNTTTGLGHALSLLLLLVYNNSGYKIHFLNNIYLSLFRCGFMAGSFIVVYNNPKKTMRKSFFSLLFTTTTIKAFMKTLA